MKHVKFSKFMSATLAAALALSLAVPAFALEYKTVKGEPDVFGDSELTMEITCDHNHTHWEDKGEDGHDKVCDDCGEILDHQDHKDEDGDGVCDDCGNDEHRFLIASVPLTLPIAAKVNGDVTAPTNAEIVNLTEGKAIKVSAVSVSISGDWSLVDGNTVFTEADKGNRSLALSFRDTPVMANGSLDIAQSDWTIAVGGTLPLNMKASMPTQTKTFASSSVGTVTFTLDWADEVVTP